MWHEHAEEVNDRLSYQYERIADVREAIDRGDPTSAREILRDSDSEDNDMEEVDDDMEEVDDDMEEVDTD